MILAVSRSMRGSAPLFTMRGKNCVDRLTPRNLVHGFGSCGETVVNCVGFKSPSSLTTTTFRQYNANAGASVSESEPAKKGLLDKVWSRVSIFSQRDRAVQASCLFAAAERRTMDPCWYTNGRLPRNFRSKHMVLSLHVWLLHRRLVSCPLEDDQDENTNVQEHMFETLWTDTTGRIRVEPDVNEMMVSKYLKQLQQLTFTSFMHFDNAFNQKTHDEMYSHLSTSIWHHLYQSSPDISDDPIHRLTDYVFDIHDYILNEHSSEYWKEGRNPFPDSIIPDFSNMLDSSGKQMKNVPYNPATDPWYLPDGWLAAQTEAGERYYWHPETRNAQWHLPLDCGGKGSKLD